MLTWEKTTTEFPQYRLRATAAENLDFAIGRSDRSWMLLVTHDSEPTVYLHDSLRAAKDDAESVAVELLG